GLAAALGSDGRIYAIGGLDGGNNVVNTVEAYTPGATSWSPVASMPTPRVSLAAAALGDGRIYAIGGENNAVAFDAVEGYSPSSSSWSKADPLPTPRSGLAAVTGIDGNIYAIGGFDGSRSSHAVEVLSIPAPPTLTSPGDQTAVEGASSTFNLGSFSDPNGGPW